MRRASAGSDRTLGWHPGPGGSTRRADAAVLPLRHHHQGLCRRRLHGLANRLGKGNVRLYRGSGQTHRAASVQGSAQTLDRGTHPRMAELVPPIVKELRHESAETMIHIAFAHQLLRRYT